MGRSVGIDLGTTNSCVAVFEGGEPRIMAAGDGSRTVPSVVAFSEDGGRLVGQLAKRQSITNPLGTVSSVKRIIGRRLAEIDTTTLPSGMQLTEGPNGAARVFVHGQARAPEAISAMVLEHLKEAASDWLGEEVTDAVVTVPAYFNAAQRQATSDAGKIAGLNVLRVINEPTAAALAYGIDKGDTEQTVLVFDLGGGTFDVSVLELGDGVFDVKATAGDNHLGGDDFDGVIVEWALAQIAEKNGVDLRGDVQAMQRLYEAAEKAKQELSGVVETSISLPFIASDAAGAPVHLDESLTRSRFEILAGELLERLAIPTEQVITDAGLEPGDLDHVLLVGGMTRMPAVSTRVREITGRDPNRQINPDEAVALGAAIQAEVLSGDMRDVLLLDVTPLSMGIETKGGIFSRLIERNTTIPARATQIFTTAEDNQPSVEIHVLQGEREMARDNRSLGRLQLLGIPPAPRGVPQIEVSFQLDANGMLQVAALDVGTGQRQEATMEGSSGLDEAMLNEMMEEAERFSSIDRRARKVAELRNKADALVYSAEQTITRHGDQLPADVRNRLLDAVAALRDGLLGGANPEELQGLSDDLTAASHLLADRIYSDDASANGGLGAEANVTDAVVIDEESADSSAASA